MFTTMAQRVAGPFVLARLLRALHAHGALPVPHDAPRVHVDGPDPQRVLLLGGLVAGSHGVVSHQLGLTGHLARLIHSITRRGIEVEVASVLPGSARQLTDELEGWRPGGFDAIVTLVGGIETRSLWSQDRWRRDMGLMLTRLTELAPGVPVLVIAVTPLPRWLPISTRLRTIVDRGTRRLNAVTEQLVSGMPGCAFLELPVSLPASGEALLPSFAEAAGSIAPALAALLLRRASAGPRPFDDRAESRRQGALDLLGILDSGADPEYERVADHARDLLEASGAAVTFIDRDRQYIKAASGLPTADTSRWLAFCDETIRSGSAFVVEETDEESGFAGHPWVVGAERVRSYAGYPLRAPTGEAVGAICVVDTEARRFSELDLSLLRHLALRLQLLLWPNGEPARQWGGSSLEQ